MAKRTSRRKPETRLNKAGKWARKNRLPLGIGLIVIALFFVVPIFFSIFAPPTGGSTGYMVFRIVDSETGTELTGTFWVTTPNVTDELYTDEVNGINGTIDTGTTYLFTEAVYCTIASVTLEGGDTRVVFPKTIAPIGNPDPNNPYENVIVVSFQYDRDDVQANITKRDGITGNYNETDFLEEVEYEIELTINITTIRNDFGIYGSSGFVTDYALTQLGKTDTLGYDINGYGLWFCLNGTDLVSSESEYRGLNAWVYNEAFNFSMILVSPVYFSDEFTQQTETISFKSLDEITGTFIFEGFLEDVEDNFITLGAKSW